MNEWTIPPDPWQPWSCTRASSALLLFWAFLLWPIPTMAEGEPASQQQEQECTPISVGQTIVASLERRVGQEGSPESVPPESASIYRCFRLSPSNTGDILLIGMQSEEVDSYVEVFDSTSRLVASDDDSGVGLNAWLRFATPADSDYTIHARSYSGEATGPFSLHVEQQICTRIQPGETTTGVLSDTDPEICFELDLSAADTLPLLIGMQSEEVDSYLQLVETVESGTRLVAFDDDSGVGLNAWLRLGTVANPPDPPYRIRARSSSRDQTGSFSLGVEQQRCRSIQPQETTDVLSVTHPEICFDLVPATDTLPNPLLIGMQSQDVDSYLELVENEGGRTRLVAFDDDSGDGRNAQLSYAVDQGKSYRILAGSFFGQETGRFSLSFGQLEALTEGRVIPPPEPRDVLRNLRARDNEKPSLIELCSPPLRSDSPRLQSDTAGTRGDPLHPSHFVHIYERTSKGEIFKLFEPSDSVTVEAGDEVDERSTIVVDFNRQHLMDYGGRSDFVVGVEATVQSGDQRPPVEVLGYQQLGTQQEPAAARIAATNHLLGLLCDVALESGRNDDPHPLAEFRRLAGVWADTLGSITGPQDESLRQELESLRTDWKIQAATMGSGLAGLSSWAAALQRLRDLSNAELELLANPAHTTPTAVRELMDDAYSAAESLRSFERTDNHEADAQRAVEAIQDLADNMSLLEALLRATNDALPNKGGDVLRRQLIDKLRKGEIPLLAQGIRDGSTVTVTISNEVNDDGVARAMRLHFNVRRFGIDPVPQIRDSFLFLNRGVGDSADVAKDAVPIAASGLPTAGTSAFWSYYHRENRFLQTVKPGFGINVSFPQFGTRTTSEIPVAGTTSSKFITENQSVGLGVGLLLLLRDGLVQVTWGYNFGVDENREYWGLGFSFGEVGRRVAAASDGDAG